jgi:16S rRNA (adenine1518-N6/adenine1519-N6)-dimethyltransferase
LPEYNSGPALRAYLHERGLEIRKHWGQNFLINPSARKAIIDALEAEEGGGVWEIGSGMGAMTAELLNKNLKVKAFEIDPGFCSILEELFSSGGAFTLVRGDVLKTWENENSLPGSVRSYPYLLGNLPYTIAAVLVGNLIEKGRLFTRMAVTVQKEVARRMAAPPGSKEFSSISVLCASAYTINIFMTLKGASFYPVPHVESAALRFDLRRDRTKVPALFYPLVRALFASRRKTIANNLEHFLANSCTIQQKGQADAMKTALEQSGVRGGDRAEKLPVEAFLSLASELEKYFAVIENSF